MSEENFKIEKAHCNGCLHETKHFVIAERSNGGSELADESDPYCDYEISWNTTYKMLECCGCENISLQRRFYFSEFDDVKEEYYPPQISRQLPKWHDEIPSDWSEMLKEVYTALHADSRRLALMGARTLIDMFMNDQLGDIGNFAQKMSKLESNGLISKPNKVILNAVLEIGHAAAHRGHKARSHEVSQVMDIVENLLHGYVLKDAAQDLENKIPKRRIGKI
ncbi:hypothetical protein D3C80_672120 [compost metagenome]